MTEPAHLKQEPDQIPGARLLGLLAAAVTLGALGVLGSWWLGSGRSVGRSTVRLTPSALAPASLEQTPIEGTKRGLELRARQKEQLSSYSWVDRQAGIVRIPIERAIELRAEGKR